MPEPPARRPFHEFNGPSQYDCATTVVPGGDGKSYAVELAIPWGALAVRPKVGQDLLFDVGIDDSADGTNRKQQVMWNGTEKNGGDRTHWGHLKLLP
ncbi:MAG: sugar-binding protein [Verrucomicrobiota bacterium]